MGAFESNRHLLNDGVMMLRVIALSLTLFTGLLSNAAQASVVLQRPISLDTGSGELFGSMLLPKSDSPVPVVLIISGSGPTDRNGNNPDGGNNDSLKRLAWVLAKHNIASVRYDKRGVAASLAATPDERNLTLEAYVADAVAWGQKLKSDPRMGPLILLGHSEGALVATLAAPQVDAAAVISVSGSARPVDQVLRQQLSNRMPPDLLLRSNELLDSLKAGHVDEHVPTPLQVIFRPSVQPYLISLFRQDPAAAFAKLKMPALIIQGSNDMQVGVGDARMLKAAKPDAQLALIEGMNHVMRIVPNDIKRQLASYKDPQLPLAVELGSSILSFIDGLRAS
ncbi:lysophospholipase [Pseudomonas sp. CVAP|uniref:alpha/beta hydrolase n=1 Tax=Pseudomonas sp. CVAP\|nr:lysophospholipase [Pseudomonas sp. CVAP\